MIDRLNPDGAWAGTRKNAHGVDLNRNFPYRWRGGVPPSSGYYPGPRAGLGARDARGHGLHREIEPDMSVWYHQPWGAVLACRGRPQIAARYAKLAKMGTQLPGQGPARDGDQLAERDQLGRRPSWSSSAPAGSAARRPPPRPRGRGDREAG